MRFIFAVGSLAERLRSTGESVGESVERLIGNLIESAATPRWVSDAARSGKTFEGPNGNEVVAYEWLWVWGEKFSAREGGMISTRVSDWERAVPCTHGSCSRQLVHVYWVRNKGTKEMFPVGVDHLHIALGFDMEVSSSKEREIRKVITSVDPRESDKEARKVLRQVAIRSTGDVSVVRRHVKKLRSATVIVNERDRKVMVVARSELNPFLALLSPMGWAPIDSRGVSGAEALETIIYPLVKGWESRRVEDAIPRRLRQVAMSAMPDWGEGHDGESRRNSYRSGVSDGEQWAISRFLDRKSKLAGLVQIAEKLIEIGRKDAPRGVTDPDQVREHYRKSSYASARFGMFEYALALLAYAQSQHRDS